MEEEELEESLTRSREEIREQNLKNPSSYQKESLVKSLLALQDPDEDEHEDVHVETKAEIWQLLPHLQSVPEATLKKLPMSALFQLNNALAKSSKTTEKLSVNSKMAHNAQMMMKNPTQVAGGLDNRRTILHEARFLAGACCSATDIWLER